MVPQPRHCSRAGPLTPCWAQRRVCACADRVSVCAVSSWGKACCSGLEGRGDGQRAHQGRRCAALLCEFVSASAVCVCILQALHHLCLYHKLHHCGCRRICASGVGSGGGGTGEGSASTGQPAKLWPNLALLATARRWSAKSLPLVLTKRCLRHRQPHPYCLPVSRATVLFARRFGYYYSGTWDATGATISAEQARMTWSENVRTEMGSAQSTRGCALPPLMWSRHGRQARLLICMALSRVLPGSMLVAHGSLPQPSAPAAAAASSAAAMCEEAGGPPHRCRPAPAATGFPSLLLPLSAQSQEGLPFKDTHEQEPSRARSDDDAAPALRAPRDACSYSANHSTCHRLN